MHKANIYSKLTVVDYAMKDKSDSVTTKPQGEKQDSRISPIVCNDVDNTTFAQTSFLMLHIFMLAGVREMHITYEIFSALVSESDTCAEKNPYRTPNNAIYIYCITCALLW